jgi:hypothetical protein
MELFFLTVLVVSVSLYALLACSILQLLTHNWTAQQQVQSERDPPVSEAGVYSHQALLTPSFSITG